jgi:hypothetical protein
VFKNAEGDVEELAHDGAADSQVMEFAAFEDCNPRLKGFAPTPNAKRQTPNVDPGLCPKIE